MKIVLFLVLLLLQGCASKDWQNYPKPVTEGLHKFETSEELEAFIEVAKRYNKIARQNPKPFNTSDNDGALLQEVVVTAMAAPNPTSITNNQHAGADEGDIVKRVGQHLAVLRKGVVYSLSLGNQSQADMSLVSRYDLQTHTKKHQTWYDELLVYKNTLIVMGFSYEYDASELLFLDIAPDGQLQYQQTYWVPSGDYFSNDNYATRIVGDKLVFSIPRYVSLTALSKALGESNGKNKNELVAKRLTSGSTELQDVNIISQHDIYQTQSHVDRWLDMFSILVCPMQTLKQQAALSCNAVSLLGARGDFYVSSDAFYLWASDNIQAYHYGAIGTDDYAELSRRGVLNDWHSDNDSSVVYRIDLNSLQTTGVTVQGSPANQFSFHQQDDSLYLIANANSEEGSLFRLWLKHRVASI